MLLIDHIEQAHKGNKAEFARSVSVRHEQVYRFIAADCIWYEGRVYCPKTGGEK